MISLSQAKFGVVYCIEKIDNISFKIKRRLYELGLLPNHRVVVVRASLLKKAYLIEVGGYCLTLRRTIMDSIKVSKI